MALLSKTLYGVKIGNYRVGLLNGHLRGNTVHVCIQAVMSLLAECWEITMVNIWCNSTII